MTYSGDFGRVNWKSAPTWTFSECLTSLGNLARSNLLEICADLAHINAHPVCLLPSAPTSIPHSSVMFSGSAADQRYKSGDSTMHLCRSMLNRKDCRFFEFSKGLEI